MNNWVYWFDTHIRSLYTNTHHTFTGTYTSLQRRRVVGGWLLLPLCTQIAKSYWKAWQEYEVRHGNEDTFREMLRIKRSVQAQYNTQVNFMSAQMLAAASGLSTDTTHSGQTSALQIQIMSYIRMYLTVQGSSKQRRPEHSGRNVGNVFSLFSSCYRRTPYHWCNSHWVAPTLAAYVCMCADSRLYYCGGSFICGTLF